MAATWTMLALFGLEAIFQVIPWAYAVVKSVGAIYLIYIAWGMWRGARNEVKAKMTPARRAFKQGFLINVLNPKSVLFAAAVLIVIFPANMTLTENVIVVLNHLVVEVLFYIGLAFAMSTPAVRSRYLQAKVYLDRTASVVLGGLGIRLLISR